MNNETKHINVHFNKEDMINIINTQSRALKNYDISLSKNMIIKMVVNELFNRIDEDEI